MPSELVRYEIRRLSDVSVRVFNDHRRRRTVRSPRRMCAPRPRWSAGITHHRHLIHYLCNIRDLCDDCENAFNCHFPQAVFKRKMSFFQPAIDFVALLAGTVAGLLIGVYALRDRRRRYCSHDGRSWDNELCCWFCRIVYAASVASAIAWHLTFPEYFFTGEPPRDSNVVWNDLHMC